MDRQHWIRRAVLAALCQFGVAHVRTIYEFVNGFAHDETELITIHEVTTVLDKFVKMGLVVQIRSEYALI